jgi:Leucine-rich repeat (LRR) protein
VECDTAGRVTGLALSNIDLRGPVPDAIGGLSSLSLLDVSHNIITGAFPTTLYHCKSLRFINLSLNS